MCRCKQLKQTVQKVFHCVYIVYTYLNCMIYQLLINSMLLINSITNFCNKISKSQVIPWVVYTCNVKGLEEVETVGRNWMCFASFTNQRWVNVVDHSREFKAFVRYFVSNVYFSPNDSSLKTMKNVFYFI